MHRFVLALAYLIILSLGVVYAQPPTVTFPTAEGTAGLHLPFNTSNGVNPFAGDVPVDYGKQGTGNYGWLFDTWQGTSIGTGSLARYIPTLRYDSFDPPDPVPPVAMLENQDWVFHMEFRHRGEYGNSDSILYTKAEPGYTGIEPGSSREDRMFLVSRGTHANDWSILVGDDSGGWTPAATGLQHSMDSQANPPEQYIDFDVHFRTAEQELDFYWENAIVGTASTGHGRYDVSFFQWEHGPSSSGTIDFRNFRLGHIGTVSESIEGDYNGNGVVDAADYPMWRDHLGDAGLPGEVVGDGDDGTGTGTPDGMVDQDDYEFWKLRFGATTPLAAGSSSAAVPEPAGWVLMLLSVGLLVSRRRLRA